MDKRLLASQATREASQAPLLRLPSTDPARRNGTPPQTSAHSRFDVRGAAGARRRGALLRRLLALADWTALAIALAIGTAFDIDGKTFAWSLLLSPSWILVLKLHGLYDHDHRRIRHSTLDELPTLVSASALGMLALNGLLALSPAGSMDASSAIPVAATALAASLGLRAGLRIAGHPLIGMANGVAIGSPAAAEIIARRVAIHPETRFRLIGFLGP